MSDPIWQWTKDQVEAEMGIALAATQGAWVSVEGGIVAVQGQWPVMNPMQTELEGDEANRAHIARQNPQERIDDCQAKLTILGAHYILVGGENTPYPHEDYSLVVRGRDQGRGCVTCHYQGMGGVAAKGVCVTVRLMASAYKHQEGYQPKWGLPC
jgi:hypothetical protein